MSSQVRFCRTMVIQMCGKRAHAAWPHSTEPPSAVSIIWLLFVAGLSEAVPPIVCKSSFSFAAGISSLEAELLVYVVAVRLVVARLGGIQEPQFLVGNPMKKLHIASLNCPWRHCCRNALYQSSSMRICCVNSMKKLIAFASERQNMFNTSKAACVFSSGTGGRNSAAELGMGGSWSMSPSMTRL